MPPPLLSLVSIYSVKVYLCHPVHCRNILSFVLLPFQIIGRFGISELIIFIMYLDMYLCLDTC